MLKYIYLPYSFVVFELTVDFECTFLLLLTFTVVTRQPVFAAGHLRKVVVEGSNLEIQCRIPPSQMLRMTDDGSDLASNSPPVVWVRFDLKGT